MNDRDIIKKEIEYQLRKGEEATDNCILLQSELLIDKAYKHLTIAEALQKSLEYITDEEQVIKYKETLKDVVRKCEFATMNPTQNNRIINEVLNDARGCLNG